MKEKYHKWIMALFAGLIAFGAGYAIGVSTTLNKVFDIAINYFDYKNVSLGISYIELKDFAFKYISMR